MTLEEHPTSALEIVDHQSLPQDFSNKIVEAISKYVDFVVLLQILNHLKTKAVFRSYYQKYCVVFVLS